MITPVRRLVRSALVTSLTFLALSAMAQTQPVPTIATVSTQARKYGVDGLLQCGEYHFKAHLIWTGFGQEYVVHFDNRAAEAVCGNAVYRKDLLDTTTAINALKPSFVSGNSVLSYDNSSLNVKALFNPSLRRTLHKGEGGLFACNGQLAQAIVSDLTDEGLVSLHYLNANAENLCGNGRYLSISKVLIDTEKAHKPAPVRDRSYSYTRQGHMQCGRNYYEVTLSDLGFDENGTAHFTNANAEAVCGGLPYNFQKLVESRAIYGTQPSRFLELPVQSGFGFLDENRFQVGQTVDRVACKLNLGRATVKSVSKAFGLVSFTFANPQLEALCGQGRYYFTATTMFNYDIDVDKIITSTRRLEKLQNTGHVKYFAK